MLELPVQRLVLPDEDDALGFVNCDEIFQSFGFLLGFAEFGLDIARRTLAAFELIDDGVPLFKQVGLHFVVFIEKLHQFFVRPDFFFQQSYFALIFGVLLLALHQSVVHLEAFDSFRHLLELLRGCANQIMAESCLVALQQFLHVFADVPGGLVVLLQRSYLLKSALQAILRFVVFGHQISILLLADRVAEFISILFFEFVQFAVGDL